MKGKKWRKKIYSNSKYEYLVVFGIFSGLWSCEGLSRYDPNMHNHFANFFSAILITRIWKSENDILRLLRLSMKN